MRLQHYPLTLITAQAARISVNKSTGMLEKGNNEEHKKVFGYADVKLNKEYPKPIVNLREYYEHSLAAFKQLSDG